MNIEDYRYIRRLVRADLKDLEAKEIKSAIGRKSIVEYRKKLLLTLDKLCR